jgi:PAS domain S-box-containing protein
MVEGRVVGVAAVYAHQPLSDAAVQAFESVAGGIAQFIKRKRAETALRESDERIRLLLDSTAEAIMGVDLEGNCTFANQAALRMLGYENAECLAGKNIHALAHHTHSNGDPFPEADCAIRRSILSGQGSHSDDEVFWRADGTSFPAEYSSYPIFKGGEVTGAVITFLDIIDRKHAEEEQRELALLVESSDDFIVMASPGGKTIYINQGGCRLIGLDRPRDAIGADVSRFHTESAWAKIQEEVMPAATKTGQWHGEIQLRHWATGAPIDGLMNAFLVRRPETGEVLCMATVVREITARKRAEEEQRKLAAVIENSNDFIGIASPEGRILFVNPAGLKTLGLDHNDEVRDREMLEFIVPEDRAKFHEESLAALLRDGRSENEVRFVNRRSGAYVSMQQSNFIVTDPQSGQVLALATISRDISERKRAEEALRSAKDAAESANRLKSEFLANMSHEIRTPMNGILGMADLALDTELTGEQREYIEAVKLSADGLLTLLNGILDFSRIEAGKLSLQTADFDVHRMLEETVESLRPDAAEKALQITCEVAREVPRMVRGDAGRLRQVVANLVGNAIKFTQHGRVTLTAEAEPAQAPGRENTSEQNSGEAAEDLPGDFSSRGLPLHVTVRDTGIGIPREKQQLIFEAFRQADGSMTRKFGGTGLGLAIASRLVARMGGRIWVESEVGAGSEFHFTVRLLTVPLGKASASDIRPQNTILNRK